MTDATAEQDPYLWLEELTADAPLGWVRERNAEAVAALAESAHFGALNAEIREVLDAKDRIPYVMRRGDYLYNFWQDETNPRGLWRRTTLAEYRKAEPEWDVLLDIDALGAAESQKWVWQGADVLRPDYRHCLVNLSRGGADATVVREYDLQTRTFVDGGFELPEAKSDIGWIDIDRVYVGTDFGTGSLTASGYPRIVKEWRRGTPLSAAVTVYEGKPDDIAVGASHDPTEGFERDFVTRATDFYSSEKYLRSGENLVRIEVPDDAEIGAQWEWLTIELRTDWTVGDQTYPAGALLVTNFDDFLAGQRDLAVLFEPSPNTSLNHYTWTRNHLLLNTLEDVKTRIEVLTPSAAGWQREPLAGVAATGSVQIIDTSPDDDDEFMVNSSGFTEPSTLLYGHVGEELEGIKQAPAFFDAADMVVRQHFGTSADGTKIPYFVVGPENPSGPVLLNGYGGFEISLTPTYSGIIGRGWLARGGTYVVANIRGGGEYGPDWHLSAIRENRHRVYEDFVAVAKDLVDRGIAEPARLGIHGGSSNGGLLMGVMLTQYPELFGGIVCAVPLLDMKRYHLLLAGASWMAEYGDPDDPQDWEFIRKYSPYQHIEPGRPYPPALFLSSTRDDRVHPGHARKMVARLRELGYDLSYYENIEGGHGAAADNEQLAFRWALTFQFLFDRLASDDV
ncbi:prolyl oligopeptidase family serine peptidase [Fodinicola feengrottensis]|uniref:prolyl oligopeptidase family serine peptidase n=1 Tax=Fodinicola feengrottensis TaxID=435914 RepID=UPI0013D4957C|nr:prolyl oligopeptidase family serine peptidase [Fodinicola feengrottensis]